MADNSEKAANMARILAIVHMSDVTRDFNLRTHFSFEFFDVKNKQFRLEKVSDP